MEHAEQDEAAALEYLPAEQLENDQFLTIQEPPK